MQPIILASRSPRRKQLLEWAEVEFTICVQFTDESFPADLPVEQVPVHIAKNKAIATREHLQKAFHGNYANDIILAADTIVVLENEVINKPADKNEAVQMLKKLSGSLHRVITGVVIMNDEVEISFSDITEVEFHSLTDEQIEFYVDKYNPLDKAGAYAIQEWIGVVGIKSIKGDFYNVMGLPVSRVVKALEKLS